MHLKLLLYYKYIDFDNFTLIKNKKVNKIKITEIISDVQYFCTTDAVEVRQFFTEELVSGSFIILNFVV